MKNLWYYAILKNLFALVNPFKMRVQKFITHCECFRSLIFYGRTLIRKNIKNDQFKTVRCDRMCLYSCGTKNKEEWSGKYHKIELDIKIK